MSISSPPEQGQLVAVRQRRVNLLIADDVGLGKTIEAGLTVLELIIRHRARRVLVVCPASLQVQWRDQMRDKFGLEFRIVDSDLMRDLRRKRGLHVKGCTRNGRAGEAAETERKRAWQPQ
jgi:SNF2 family DNA or RNA helicase